MSAKQINLMAESLFAPMLPSDKISYQLFDDIWIGVKYYSFLYCIAKVLFNWDLLPYKLVQMQ